MLPWADPHRDQDEPDLFWIHNLRAARDVLKQISQGRLQQEKWLADVTENLAAEGQSDQVIVLDHPAMRLQLSTGLQAKDEMFVLQTDQFNQVAVLCVRSV